MSPIRKLSIFALWSSTIRREPMTVDDLDHAASPQATDAVVSRDQPPRWVRAGLIVIAILPIITSVIRSLRRDWFPIGDSALLYIRAADVFTQHHPLLGAWTSASLAVGVDMNNPGAIYDVMISPLARTLGPGAGAAIGVGLVNIASIIGIALVGHHIGGWRLQRWMIAASASLAWSMGSELLREIWQSNALLLPFLFFLVLLVGCTAGHRVCFPWAAFVGSVLLQTHISYAYILSMLIGSALVMAWWVHRPTRPGVIAGLRSKTTAVSVGVLVLVWFQSFYEQFFGEGQGNLSRLATNSGGGDVTVGIDTATRITSAVIALPPWWTRTGYLSSVPSTRLTTVGDTTELRIATLPGIAVAIVGLVLVAALLASLTVVALRRGLVVPACAGALALASVPAAVIALSLLTVGPVGFSSHHVRWLWALSAFVTFVVVWLGSEAWITRREAVVPARWPTVTAVALTTVFTLANLGYHAHPDGPVADIESMAAMRRAFPEMGLLADHDPVFYDTSNLRVFEPYSATMMMRMQELGIEFRVADEIMVRHLGNSRRADGTESTTVFQLEGAEALDYNGPACTIALASAFTPEEDAEIRATADRLAAGVVDGSIEIESSDVDESDPIDQLAAARAGDADAAWLLVTDSPFARWVGEGRVTLADGSDVSNDLARDIDLIVRWENSTFGLFAEGNWECPT